MQLLILRVFPLFRSCLHLADISRRIRPYFIGSPSAKKVYDVISVIATAVTINYFAISFVLLEAAPALQVWGSMNYVVHVIVAVMLVVLTVVPSPRKPAAAAPKAKEN